MTSLNLIMLYAIKSSGIQKPPTMPTMKMASSLAAPRGRKRVTAGSTTKSRLVTMA